MNQGTQGVPLNEKTEGRESCDTVPLKGQYHESQSHGIRKLTQLLQHFFIQFTQLMQNFSKTFARFLHHVSDTNSTFASLFQKLYSNSVTLFRNLLHFCIIAFQTLTQPLHCFSDIYSTFA
jgi:hypothetical protein